MPITDEQRERIREMSRRLANGSAARISDADMPRIVAGVHEISEGLIQITESREGAANVAATFSTLLSSLVELPLYDVGQVLQDTILAYGLAAGHVAGVYDLPKVVSDPTATYQQLPLFGDERDVSK